jgi:hypothetical protein
MEETMLYELTSPSMNAFLQAETLGLHQGSVLLAEAIADENCQLDSEGKLRYVFAGSLALNILAGVKTMREFSGKEFEFDSATLAITALAVRKIHDIDLLAFPGVQFSVSSLRFSELPLLSRELFEKEQSFDCDVLSFDQYRSTPGTLACICNIDGRDFYISHPISMLCNKFIFALRNFAHGQPEKLRSDFERLLSVASTFSDRASLLRITRQAIDEHVPYTLNWFHSHGHNPTFGASLKLFADEVVASHPDSGWLQQFVGENTHRIAILRLLARLKSDQDKRALVCFLNAHIEFLDGFSNNTRSATNRMLVARLIMSSRMDLLDALGLGAGARLDQVAAGLEDNSTLLTRMMEQSNEKFEQTPEHNTILDLLATVDRDNVVPELSELQYLLSRNVSIRDMRSILASNEGSCATARRELLSKLRNAATQLSGGRLMLFTCELDSSLNGSFRQ